MDLETERRISAIVLAAGASSRLGSPKALLDFGGRPALARVLDALRESGVRRGVCVTGAGAGSAAGAITAAVDPEPFRWIANPAPEAGRTGSVAVGLRAVDPADDVLLWPVDRPLAAASTVRALLAAAGAAPGAVVVPEHGGRGGHPLLIPAAARAAVLRADPDASLRDVLRASGAPRRSVAVEDPGIHFNLDTPEAYAAAREWWIRRNPQFG